MKNRTVARRYSQAFFELGKENNNLEKLEKDLKLVADTISEAADLKRIVENQLIPSEKKQQIFEKVFKNKIEKISLNFLFLIIQKKREPYLEAIHEEFLKFLDEHFGVEESEITVAIDLEEKEKENIRKKISEIIGKKVRLNVKVNPDIMGGIVVRIGDKVIDGSIKTKLSLLEKKLEQAELV